MLQGDLVQPPTLEGGGVSLLILDEETSGLYWPAEGRPSSSEVIFQQLGCLPVTGPRIRNEQQMKTFCRTCLFDICDGSNHNL